MDLLRYAAGLDALHEELVSSLSTADRSEIRGNYAQEREILELLDAHREEIYEYILATPATRKKLLKWRDRRKRLMMTLGALYCIQMARVTVKAVGEGSMLADQSYRQMAISACETFDAVYNDDAFEFPFS